MERARIIEQAYGSGGAVSKVGRGAFVTRTIVEQGVVCMFKEQKQMVARALEREARCARTMK